MLIAPISILKKRLGAGDRGILAKAVMEGTEESSLSVPALPVKEINTLFLRFSHHRITRESLKVGLELSISIGHARLRPPSKIQAPCSSEKPAVKSLYISARANNVTFAKVLIRMKRRLEKKGVKAMHKDPLGLVKFSLEHPDLLKFFEGDDKQAARESLDHLLFEGANPSSLAGRLR